MGCGYGGGKDSGLEGRSLHKPGRALSGQPERSLKTWVPLDPISGGTALPHGSLALCDFRIGDFRGSSTWNSRDIQQGNDCHDCRDYHQGCLHPRLLALGRISRLCNPADHLSQLPCAGDLRRARWLGYAAPRFPGVDPLDPVSFATPVGFLLLVVLLAGVASTRKASGLDPRRALCTD